MPQLFSSRTRPSHFLRRISSIVVFMAALWLSGCSHLSDTNKTAPFSTQTQRHCVSDVSLKGRFSIQYQAANKEESLHGNFDWQQTADHIIITLSSPLGQSMARIDVTPNLTTFMAPGRAPRSAANAESLIASELGWALPVSGLKDWLQGCATNQQNQLFVATPHSKQVFTQDGWQIDYTAWIDGPVMPLPKRIDLIKGGRNTLDVDIHLKLVIDEWHFPKLK